MESPDGDRSMTRTHEPPPTCLTGGILSFLVPGLGQIYQGRTSKGLLFFVVLLSLFHVGQAMGGWQNVYMPPVPQNVGRNPIASVNQRWHFAGQFWIGVSAWPAVWQFYDLPTPDPTTAKFWHEYQRAPNETAVNAFLVDSDKTPDLGLIYTVIAGVLNILVIYDAYAGAAFPPPDDEPKKDPAQPEATP